MAVRKDKRDNRRGPKEREKEKDSKANAGTALESDIRRQNAEAREKEEVRKEPTVWAKDGHRGTIMQKHGATDAKARV